VPAKRILSPGLAGQRLGVGVEEDNVLARHKRGHVSEVIDRVESEAEATDGRRVGQFLIGANRTNVAEVVGRELRVVEAVERGPLPRLHRRAEQRRVAVRTLVQQECDTRGARIVGILDELV